MTRDIEQKPKRRTWKHKLLITALVIAGLHGVAFTVGSTSSHAQDSTETFKEDVVATDACIHYRNIMKDVADGVLTDAELRTKLQEVDKTASASEVAEIRTAARNVLSTVTTGTTDEAISAMGKMSGICTDYIAKVSEANEAEETNKQGGDSKDSDCFIATSAYGTHLTHDLDVFRDFRDNSLRSNAVGSAFVSEYYKYGPAAADFIRDKDLLRGYIREFYLKPTARILEIF